MAPTESLSGRGARPRRAALPRRLSLRLRLTLLYGACFLTAGAAVLAITYVLVAHVTNSQSQRLSVHGTQTEQPAYHEYTKDGRPKMLTLDHIYLGNTEITTWAPSQGGKHKRAPQQLGTVVDTANGALAIQRSDSLRALITWSAVALGAMALLSIVLGWLLAGRALRPLRRMSSRARRISEQNLHERLSVDTQEDELGELANSFDDVLARLQRAFDAQKRFVANASHELRTPVTLEHALLEYVLSDPDASATQLRHTCERVLLSAQQQQRTLEALLTLARGQAGPDLGAPVDLAELAQEAVALQEQRLAGITLATDLHPAPVTGDPAQLERLVTNLIDNAITHNRADDAWITVETGQSTAGSWLRVSNSGAQIADEMLAEIFEPFRRLQGERTTTSTGLGLGLSIVQAIAEVHGAAVSARSLDGGGLQLEVRF